MTFDYSGSLDWLTARPIAHRGLHDRNHGVIENSQSAFAAAMDHGYAIECDLQLAGDGEAVVFHDSTVDRLTDQHGPVNQLSAAKLGRMSLKGSDDCPQTLEQLLRQVDDRVPLIIELKSLWDSTDHLAARTCEIVWAYGGRAAVMSFDPYIMVVISKIAPHLPRGGVAGLFRTHSWPELTETQRTALRQGDEMAQTNPMFMSYPLDALETASAKLYRAGGKPMICWTVRDEASARYALEHCDQITFEGFLP